MKNESDPQKIKVYEAGETAFGGCHGAPLIFPEEKLSSQEEVEDFTDEVCRTLKYAPIRVKFTKSKASSAFNHLNTIKISKSKGFRKTTVLHEISHIVADDGHGPRFCRCLLELVSHFMGDKPKTNLELAFDHKKVEVDNNSIIQFHLGKTYSLYHKKKTGKNANHKTKR